MVYLRAIQNSPHKEDKNNPNLVTILVIVASALLVLVTAFGLEWWIGAQKGEKMPFTAYVAAPLYFFVFAFQKLFSFTTRLGYTGSTEVIKTSSKTLHGAATGASFGSYGGSGGAGSAGGGAGAGSAASNASFEYSGNVDFAKY